MSTVRSRCVADLDVYAACGLLALLRGREERRPIAPTKAFTIQILETLRIRGVVEVPWPAARWELPPRGYLTPLEQLGWEYVWPEVELGGLGHHLEDFLQCNAGAPDMADQRLAVWQSLIRAECAEYFEFQLSKHGFDPTWSSDLDWLPARYWDELSLARWKYLIWSAVRHGAQECLRSQFDGKQTREAIARMLMSPQRFGFAIRGHFDGFLPKAPLPHSLMGDSFVRFAKKLGFLYWTEPPNESAVTRASPRAEPR